MDKVRKPFGITKDDAEMWCDPFGSKVTQFSQVPLRLWHLIGVKRCHNDFGGYLCQISVDI